jgi:hypothetical protein
MLHPKSGRLAPVFSLLLAGGALASMAWFPGWLPVVAVAAVALLAGATVTRRCSLRLGLAIAVVAALLALGLAGAWLLRASPKGGLGWTLLVVFAIPLPLVPWLYWLTFDRGVRGPGSGVRVEGRSTNGESHNTMSGPVPGSRSPVPGQGAGQ